MFAHSRARLLVFVSRPGDGRLVPWLAMAVCCQLLFVVCMWPGAAGQLVRGRVRVCV